MIEQIEPVGEAILGDGMDGEVSDYGEAGGVLAEALDGPGVIAHVVAQRLFGMVPLVHVDAVGQEELLEPVQRLGLEEHVAGKAVGFHVASSREWATLLRAG